MKGFTLIELLVVLAIIGILSAVILAALNGGNVSCDTFASFPQKDIPARCLSYFTSR